jgi:hypothetical protein
VRDPRERKEYGAATIGLSATKADDRMKQELGVLGADV